MKLQGGPRLGINRVITPISRVKSPQLPMYFWPFIGVITPFVTGRAHLVGGGFKDFLCYPYLGR